MTKFRVFSDQDLNYLEGVAQQQTLNYRILNSTIEVENPTTLFLDAAENTGAVEE